MARGKRRYCFVTAEQTAEVFSVSESATGDLLIAYKPIFQLNGSPINDLAKENRFTVHRSALSKIPGRTITYTKELVDGRVQRDNTFVSCADRPFLWPIFTRRYNDLRGELLRSHPKKKDIVRVIGEVDASKNTVVLMVAVSDHGAYNSNINLARGTIYDRYRNFDLIVTPNYVHETPHQEGYYAISSAGRAQFDGSPLFARSLEKVESMTPDEVIDYFGYIKKGLAEQWAMQRAKDHGPPGSIEYLSAFLNFLGRQQYHGVPAA